MVMNKLNNKENNNIVKNDLILSALENLSPSKLFEDIDVDDGDDENILEQKSILND